MVDNFRHTEQAIVVPSEKLRSGQRASRISLFNANGSPYEAGGGGSSIDDDTVSKNSTWSSEKTDNKLNGKANNLFAIMDPEVGLISGMTGEPIPPEQSGMSDDEYGLLYSVAMLHFQVFQSPPRYSETKVLVPGGLTTGSTEASLGFAKAREQGGFNEFLFTEIVLDTPSTSGPIEFKLKTESTTISAIHEIPEGETTYLFPVEYRSQIALTFESETRVFLDITKSGVGASGLTATVLRSSARLS